MNCTKCGSTIPEQSNFCPTCGHKTTPGQAEPHGTVIQASDSPLAGDGPLVVSSSEAPGPIQPVQSWSAVPFKKYLPVIGVVLALVVGIFLWQNQGKAELKKLLLKDWSRIETSDTTTFQLELDFSEDEIEYNFNSSYAFLNSKIATYDYDVIGKDTIKVTSSSVERLIKIEFNDDKDMMTMTPALTSTDDSENWFFHD